MHLGRLADSHVPLATNKRSDHEPVGRPLPKKYDARTLELIDPLIDLAPIDKTPSTADLLEEGTPPSSPAPVVVSSPVVRNRAGSA